MNARRHATTSTETVTIVTAVVHALLPSYAFGLRIASGLSRHWHELFSDSWSGNVALFNTRWAYICLKVQWKTCEVCSFTNASSQKRQNNSLWHTRCTCLSMIASSRLCFFPSCRHLASCNKQGNPGGPVGRYATARLKQDFTPNVHFTSAWWLDRKQIEFRDTHLQGSIQEVMEARFMSWVVQVISRFPISFETQQLVEAFLASALRAHPDSGGHIPVWLVMDCVCAPFWATLALHVPGSDVQLQQAGFIKMGLGTR